MSLYFNKTRFFTQNVKLFVYISSLLYVMFSLNTPDETTYQKPRSGDSNRETWSVAQPTYPDIVDAPVKRVQDVHSRHLAARLVGCRVLQDHLAITAGKRQRDSAWRRPTERPARQFLQTVIEITVSFVLVYVIRVFLALACFPAHAQTAASGGTAN